MTTQTSVGIIGAGIAGLVTAKVLKTDGFHVTVFDKASEVGGTWTKANTYPGLRTNNSKRTYEFSDFAYPDDVADHPTHDEVRAYLNAYIDNFALRDNIKLEREVLNIRREGQHFALTVKDNDGDAVPEELTFDKIVVCNGIFHHPTVPDLTGRDEFDGMIMHSSEVGDSSFVDEEALVVVGGGKSAYDIAEEAARRGMDVTLVVRSPQWRAPRYGPDGVPGDYGLYIRSLHRLMPYYGDSPALLAQKAELKDACNALWNDFSDQFAEALAIPDSLLPSQKLPVDLPHLAAGGDIYQLAREGKVKVERTGVARLSSSGLELESGKGIGADRIVFATGWQRNYNFIRDELESELFDAEMRLPLYRNILPPTVPGLAFNGHASSFSCTLTAEIGAHWISEFFLGRINLPPSEEMDADIDRYRNWADEWLVERPCDSFIGPFHIPYVFALIEDMRGGETLIRSLGDDPDKVLLPRVFQPITEVRKSERAS